MTPYYLVYALAASGVPICLIKDGPLRRAAQKIYLTIAIIVFAAFAGARSGSVDRDYQSYLYWFNLVAHDYTVPAAWFRDPAFAFMSLLVAKMGFSYPVLAFIYAILGMLATLWFVIRVTPERWRTLFFYLLFCLYFVVGVMTEIRFEVAAPLMAVSLSLACEGRRRHALGIFLLAVVFHFEAIAALPFLLLIFAGVRFKSRVWIYALIPLGIITAIEMDRVIQLLLNVYRISEYVNGGAEENDLRVVSWYALAHVLIIGAAMFTVWKRLSLNERVATVCCSLGLTLFFVFGSNTGLATRFLNLFDVFWLLLMVILLDRWRGSYRQTALIALLLLIGLGLFVKSLQFIEPYSMAAGL